MKNEDLLLTLLDSIKIKKESKINNNDVDLLKNELIALKESLDDRIDSLKSKISVLQEFVIKMFADKYSDEFEKEFNKESKCCKKKKQKVNITLSSAIDGKWLKVCPEDLTWSNQYSIKLNGKKYRILETLVNGESYGDILEAWYLIKDGLSDDDLIEFITDDEIIL